MTNFQAMVAQFAQSTALRGSEPWLPGNNVWLPAWQDFNTEYRSRRIEECVGEMPERYRSGYAEQLQSNMDRLKVGLRKEYDCQRLKGLDQSFLATQAADWVTIMVDAVLNWAGQSIEAPHRDHGVDAEDFKRFTVVIWDFYDKFTSAYNEVVKQARHDLEKKTAPRPLAVFSPTRIWGPQTINETKMSQLIGSHVGVVSLPSQYAKYPLLWAPLAHEVFGHDVSHGLGRTTSAHLTPQIIRDFQNIAASCVSAEWRHVWRTWIEELAADLAGLLCLGPYFAISFAASMSVTSCGDPFSPLWQPGRVGTTLVARGGRPYDEHPPDLLRLYAMRSAAEAMLKSPGFGELSHSVEALKCVVHEAHPPACMIDVFDFDAQSVLMRYDCGTLIRDAQSIGEKIITEPLKSLGDRRITCFHSWNDTDERKARMIEQLAFAHDETPTLPDGIDSSHLLTGATMALYAKPDAFCAINEFLRRALSERAKNAGFPSLALPGEPDEGQ